MYFFACLINTFKQALTDLQDLEVVSLVQEYKKSWTIANMFLVSKCSWSFPNKSIDVSFVRIYFVNGFISSTIIKGLL